MDRYLPSKITSVVDAEIEEVNYGVDMEKLVKEIKKGALRFED